MKCLLYIQFFFLVFSSLVESSVVNTETRTIISEIQNSAAVMNFDPYVSILDKLNKFRYKVADLIPMVAKVATRFSRLLIHLREIDLEQDLQTSLALSPLAVAQYNNISTHITKLEVWLAYSAVRPDAAYKDDFKYHKQPFLLESRLQNLAKEANKIFDGTVTTILIPYDLARLYLELPVPNISVDDYCKLFQTTKYRWGTLLDALTCTYAPSYLRTLQRIPFEIVIMALKYPINNDIRNHNPFKEFNLTLGNCQTYIPNGTLKGFLASISDTDSHEASNITRFVISWQQILKWFEQSGMQLIISKAFDIPSEISVELKTSGWWRLIENPSYNSSSYYIFEEKLTISKDVEKSENPMNFTWLQDDIKFAKPNTGIIFSAYKTPEYSAEDMQPLLDYITTKFSKIVLCIQDSSLFGKRALLFEIRNAVKLKGRIGIVVLTLISKAEFQKLLPFELEKAAYQHNFDKRLFSTYVIPYTGNTTFEYITYYKDFVLKNINSTDYEIGFAFDTNICLTYNKMDSYNFSLVTKAFEEAQVIYFLFEEDEETIKLGATRMFLQRIVLLQQCRNLLLATLENVSDKDVTYVLIHYPTTLTSEFYLNPWRLQNFVKYWKLLNDWAKNTNITLIFSNVMDSKRYMYDRKETVSELGWWQYLDIISEDNPNRWVDKQFDALQLSMKHFHNKDQKNSPQAQQVILMSVLPVIIIITIFVVSLYMVRRYYQTTYISKTDLEEFFSGTLEEDDDNNVYRLPYDENCYEIDESSFSIDEGQYLGSGEFGKVYSGKIVTQDLKSVLVAVKTNNPKKFHKTTLSGLLSEIKVLAHLGKHKNITELLGACTKNLKQGKVLIFLEFCHLGSLQNYLRKLRPISEDFKNANDEQDNVSVASIDKLEGGNDYKMQKYVNVPASRTVVLDAALSEDLCRWSKEICEGMAYLASKHVVHADLATRNVLLNLNKEAKLCDFGLARRMYNYTNYVKQQQEPLPWKWMSPESLRLLEFSEKSDVWAYGITLWEIYSLGDAPYPGLSWDPNFAAMLECGLRLSEPKFSENHIYSIMKKCWNKLPERRPTFGELFKIL